MNWAQVAVQTVITAMVTLGSFYGGMTAASAQQDRDNMRKQRGVAKALLADVQRIEDAIVRMREAGLTPYTGRPPVPAPTIHPWVEGLISQIADAAPQVVTRFMELQRSLAMVGDGADRARLASERVSERYHMLEVLERDRRTRFERGPYDPLNGEYGPAPDAAFPELSEDMSELATIASTAPPDDLATSSRVKHELMEARERAERARLEYHALTNEAVGFVISIERHLRPIAEMTVPDVPALVGQTLFKVPEDDEMQRLADERRQRARGS